MASSKRQRLKDLLADRRKWKRYFGPLLLIAALFIASRTIDLNHHLQDLQKWILQFGHWGPAIFVCVYVTAILFLFPGLPFTILAAFLFGSLKGFVVMMVATNLAAIAGFAVARYLACAMLERRLAKFGTLEKLRTLVEKNHWLAIPFVRLMPIFPFSLNNYALGLTHVPFWRYLVFSEIVFIPMNAVWVFGANTVYAAMTSEEVSLAVMGGATAAGLLVLALVYAVKRLFVGNAAPGNGGQAES